MLELRTIYNVGISAQKQGFDGFTKKYNVHKLVYVETMSSIKDAIKQLKSYSRQGKNNLIVLANPLWNDLSE